ncbi:hypothetical protein [Shewanella sp. Isolate11]|uniref:hypothetical protein n=1 Tax=Shewanella sp. Isolate11 TaxID=2908530 RepID=UPI001EFCF229|nr:hypothetical protein [Shewanella sp. Isolate11]MCG9698018.1 hypothetical protein [Shewanella sp. Isolate11]
MPINFDIPSVNRAEAKRFLESNPYQCSLSNFACSGELTLLASKTDDTEVINLISNTDDPEITEVLYQVKSQKVLGLNGFDNCVEISVWRGVTDNYDEIRSRFIRAYLEQVLESCSIVISQEQTKGTETFWVRRMSAAILNPKHQIFISDKGTGNTQSISDHDELITAWHSGQHTFVISRI